MKLSIPGQFILLTAIMKLLMETTITNDGRQAENHAVYRHFPAIGDKKRMNFPSDAYCLHFTVVGRSGLSAKVFLRLQKRRAAKDVYPLPA